MPREVNGVQTIIKAAQTICRQVNRFGTTALGDWTSEEFVAATIALALACQAVDALDDYVGKVDRVAPGFRDGPPVG